MPGPEVADVLRRLDGAAQARDLVRICGRNALRRALRTGEVVKVSYGRYALATCEDPWRTAVRLSGVVSHLSAAQLWGIDVLTRPTSPHITVGRHRHGIDTRGASLHWADLRPDQLDERGRVTSPLRTVLDCARSLPFAEALAVADSALRQQLVTPSDLSRAADALAGAGRRRIARLVEHADGRAESVLESGLRSILIEGSILSFVPQVVIRDEALFARVDLADRTHRTVLEADSFEYHGSRAALVRDCFRYNELTVRGWTVLRFAWEQVMFEAPWVLATVEQALALPSRRQLSGQKVPSADRSGRKQGVRPAEMAG